MSTPERSDLASSTVADRPFSQATKPQRVLACVLCQNRKVKCDRKVPCGNCIRSNAQCVPATKLAPRRRRFPEKELLGRLRHYESLLRRNNVKFEPIHRDPSTTEKESPGTRNEDRSNYSPSNEQLVTATGGDQSSSPSTTVKSEIMYETKDIWHAMNQSARPREPDDNSSDSSNDEVHEAVVRKAWDDANLTDDLLFWSRETAVDLFTLHPEQVHIFRLWQIYIDNVNPLLRVTHTPTMQGRIIDAASNLVSIEPNLLALMFSIYCMAILSLSEDECRATFGSPRERLLRKYQFGCQQALLDCEFLRSSDRNCLTALYLYLISVRFGADPQSLSSMLGVAIRVAQRMGLHSESACARFPALEAEMRRRLWWSLILFDTRISEMTDNKTAMLIPTWDCAIPLNVNDSDLQPEMKVPPAVQERPTEALFAVVRSEIGEFVRHSAFHLDFINPALKAVAKDVRRGQVHLSEGSELTTLERMIEDKYLRFCNPENPLHFMTIWMTRGFLAKSRLLEHFSRYPTGSSVQQTDAQRDAAVSYALHMLECDTKLMTSPLTKAYHWFIHLYFPFPAYMYLVQDLKRHPVSTRAERTWETMSDNYAAQSLFQQQEAKWDDSNPFFKIFAKMIFQAWGPCESALRESGQQQPPPPALPRIVADIRGQLGHDSSDAQSDSNANTEQPVDEFGADLDLDFSMSMSMPRPLDSCDHDLLYGMGGGGAGQGYAVGSGMMPYCDMPGQAALDDVDLNALDWTSLDWRNQMQG